MSEQRFPKQAAFIGSARRDLQRFPDTPRKRVGYALYRAQQGAMPPHAKPLKGFDGASVIEIVEDFDGDTYRTVYTARFTEVLYILHCFQKKSKTGRKTPKQEVELIQRRLRDAETHYATNFGGK